MTPTLITIRLRLLSPGGVAGPERRQVDRTSELSNHLPLRQDPDGAVALPGSTVAGSLRAHCGSWPGLPDGLFGSEPGAQEKVASPVQVLGVRLHGDLPAVESAARVAIDRHRGAARVHALFTVEQLPAGTEFDVHLRWDGAGAALESFLDAVRAWRPRIGRGVTTGSGACAVTGLGWATYDLTHTDGLLAWLAVEGPGTYPQPTEVLRALASPDAVIDVGLEIVDGLHVGTGVPGQLPDHEGEVSLVVQRHSVPQVPGSSLKGVLRSRVEYICRVLGQPACDDASCGGCRACLLFGWSPRSGADPQLGGARAAVAIPDATIDAAEFDVRSHVALDRVTGGARPGLLYTQQVVVAGHFRLRVEPLRPLTDVELALLRASIADLHDGLVGIGAATTRGLGRSGSTTRPGCPLTCPRWQRSSREDLMTEQMSLHGSGSRGREQWRDLVGSLPHATAAWADLEGMHCAPLPQALPIGATHLWFWDTGRYGRVRIDGEHWIAGVLTDRGVSAPAHCDALREDAVEVDQVTLTAWAADDQRVWQFRGDPEVLVGLVQLVPRRQTTGVFLAAAGQRA